MISLYPERKTIMDLAEDDYNLLAESAKQEGISFSVHLIRRVEAYWREIRLDYSEVPQGIMASKSEKEQAAFKVYLAWKALGGAGIRVSYDVAQALATGYVPDTFSDYVYYDSTYGWYRGPGKGDRTKVTKFRVGEHSYKTILEMSHYIHANGDVEAMRYLRNIKLALFYELIKQSELTEYLDNLIYGDKPKENV